MLIESPCGSQHDCVVPFFISRWHYVTAIVNHRGRRLPTHLLSLYQRKNSNGKPINRTETGFKAPEQRMSKRNASYLHSDAEVHH